MSYFLLLSLCALFVLPMNAAAVVGTEVSTAKTPTPKVNPMIIDGILRLSIIDEGCMRVERGTFHDEQTM
ncbi:hypothetical protein IKS73_03960, partial [bacterium]|nr:hypothetical protein [bacterium]